MPAEPRVIPIACPFGPSGTVWVYYIDAPRPALIDCGVTSSPQAVIEPALANAGFKLSDVRWILATHGHWDHIGGAATAKERAAEAQIALHPADNELLQNRRAHIAGYQGVRFRFIDDPATLAAHDALLMENLSGDLAADRSLGEGDRVDLGGGIVVTTLHTPGHSPGSVTFLIEGPDWAFTGDGVQAGGSDGGRFPLVELPYDYRDSVTRLKSDVRPNKMFTGHRFLDGDGQPMPAQLESAAQAQAALAASLDMEARIREAAAKCDPSLDTPGNYRLLAPVAEAFGYDPTKPGTWPASFFITVCGYLPRRQASGT